VQNYVVDPLSEEVLKGAFQGSNTITVRVMEVGDVKRLDFEPSKSDGEGDQLIAAAESVETA